MGPLQSLLTWVGVFALVALGYEVFSRYDADGFDAFVAPQQTTVSPGEVRLRRASNGHFSARVLVNGAPMRMLVDTGATDVALPFEDAERAGVDMARLRFDEQVITANGIAKVASVRLDAVSLGEITLRDVRASVSQPGALAKPLLGMSFLGRLREVSFRGETLVLVR